MESFVTSGQVLSGLIKSRLKLEVFNISRETWSMFRYGKMFDEFNTKLT